MKDNDAAQRDVLWKMFQEHRVQARHQDIQRASTATALTALAGAAIGVATFDGNLELTDLPLTIFVAVVGIFGVLFSIKYYERFRLHVERSYSCMRALDKLLDGQPLARTTEEAGAAHDKNSKYPRIRKWRIYKFWNLLHSMIFILGLILTGYASSDWWSTFIIGFSLHGLLR